MKQLVIISDICTSDSLALQEIRSTIAGYVQQDEKPQIFSLATSLEPYHAAFLASQLATTEEQYGRPLETILCVDLSRTITPNDSYHIARLKSGLLVASPSSSDFAFLIGDIDRLFMYSFQSHTSPFPLRDVYARILALLIDELEDELDLNEMPLTTIDPPPGAIVGQVVEDGSITITVKESAFKAIYQHGQEVAVSIDGFTFLARYTSHDEKSDDTIIYLGSEGDHADPYLRISFGKEMLLFPRSRFSFQIAEKTICAGQSVSIPRI